MFKILTSILILFLSACQPVQSPPHASLRTNIKGEPSTLDPRKGGDLFTSTLHFLLFEGLTRLEPDGSITHAQAHTIDISSDRKLYTFHLRKNVWSDGSPVTAYDFEYAWKKIVSPDFPAPNAHLLYPIKNAEAIKQGKLPIDTLGVHAVDATTLKVELLQPTPYFLDLISFCIFAPVKCHIDETCPEWANPDSLALINNGPFQLQKWKHTEEILVTKNPLYRSARKISLSSIHFSMIAHEMTIWHLFEKGELDLVALETSSIPITEQLDLAKKQLLTFKPTPSSTICVFNTQAFPFNNLHIRKAFALAIDRESLVKNITQRQEMAALQVVPPILKHGRNTPFIKDAAHDEALIELELGLKELNIEKESLNGITYSYSSSERNHIIAQALQQQWQRVLGVQVDLKTYEVKLHLSNLFKRNFHMTQSQLIAQYDDPMNFLERFSHAHNVKNYTGWENPQFSQLLASSFQELRPEKRLDILHQAEALLMADMPLTPLFHGSTGILAKPYVKNIKVYKNGNPDLTQLSISHSDP